MDKGSGSTLTYGPLALAALLLIGVWGLSAGRSLTAEEAIRLARATQPGTRDLFDLFLASWTGVVGSSELALRIPSLVGALVALVAVWRSALLLLPHLTAASVPLLALAATPILSGATAVGPATSLLAAAGATLWIALRFVRSGRSAAGEPRSESHLGRRLVHRVSLLLLTIALVAAGIRLWTEPGADYPDYRGLVAQVLREGRAGDLLVLAAADQRDVVEYYNHGRASVIELPFAPALIEETAEVMLSSLTKVPRGLWVLRVDDSAHDPNRRVKRWFSERLYAGSEFSYGGNVLLGSYFSEPEMQPGTSRVVFGNVIEVPEVAVAYGTTPRDMPLAVRVTWRAREPINTHLLTVLELVLDDRVAARLEVEPVSGTRPSTTWEPGEMVEDRLAFSIPEGVPVGEYTVRVGLADAATHVRLKQANGSDTLDLGKVRIGAATRGPI